MRQLSSPPEHDLTLTEAPRPLVLPVTAPTLDAAIMFTVLADITDLVMRAPNDAAVGSGVRGILDARPLPGLRAALGPGSTGEDVARLFGSLLVALPIPFTVIMRGLTRQRPRIEALPCDQCPGMRCRGHIRPLTEDEADALHLPPDTGVQGWHRPGIMSVGKTTAADTAVTLIPDLVPAGVLDIIRDGTPVGTALPDLARVDTTVELRWPDDPGLVVTAVICLNGHRAGVTSELVTCTMLDKLAKGAAP
jgi:hypothetical protein